jgi:hypothetical protein
MIGFLIIVGLLIFAPMVLVVIGAGVLLLVIPFAVFFGVWGLTTYTILQMAPNSGSFAIGFGFIAGTFAIGFGFIAGIIAARLVVKKVFGTSPTRMNVSR